MYSVRAFARLASVTVKTLHHYDKRGLLAPSRSRAGYRRYTLRDLARLERVLALKSLGFSLRQIAGLRSPRAVRAQREQLVEKRARLDRAIHALETIERDSDPARALRRFVGEASWARWEAKRAALADPAPRAPDRASPSRFALFHEIKAALDRDPSGSSARPLAVSWNALLEVEAGGDPSVVAALHRVSATRAAWPDGARRYVASLYDSDVDTWDRVLGFVAKHTTPVPAEGNVGRTRARRRPHSATARRP